MSPTYLLVLGERDAIAWVLREQRMAFPMSRRAAANSLVVGDGLLLYSTRGAWHNPPRDRSRIFGIATVTSAVAELDKPIEIAGMRFQSACDLRIDGVVPYPGGVEVQPLVRQLAIFPKPDAWSVYLRRTLVALPTKDAALLRELVDPMLTTRERALPTYPSLHLLPRSGNYAE